LLTLACLRRLLAPLSRFVLQALGAIGTSPNAAGDAVTFIARYLYVIPLHRPQGAHAMWTAGGIEI